MENNPYKRLGEILVSHRKINKLNLDEAIEKQQIYKRKIGEILIMMGLLNPEELELYLIYQREVQGQEFHRLKLDIDAYRKISASQLLLKKQSH